VITVRLPAPRTPAGKPDTTYIRRSLDVSDLPHPPDLPHPSYLPQCLSAILALAAT